MLRAIDRDDHDAVSARVQAELLGERRREVGDRGARERIVAVELGQVARRVSARPISMTAG